MGVIKYIDRTDRGGPRPSLFHLSARSDRSRACALNLSLRPERWNNDDRGPPRSVLYLLYLKHDQKIDRIRKNNNECLYLPYDHGRRHVECLPFPPDDARKRLITTVFRQMATFVFATSRSTMTKRLINSRIQQRLPLFTLRPCNIVSFPLNK